MFLSLLYLQVLIRLSAYFLFFSVFFFVLVAHYTHSDIVGHLDIAEYFIIAGRIFESVMLSIRDGSWRGWERCKAVNLIFIIQMIENNNFDSIII